MEDFKIGDIVRLKSGGPNMLVTSVDEHMVRCVWDPVYNISRLHLVNKPHSTAFSKTMIVNLSPYLKKKFLQLTAKVLLSQYAENFTELPNLTDETFTIICCELDITEELAINAMVQSNWFIRTENDWIVARNLYFAYYSNEIINDSKSFFEL